MEENSKKINGFVDLLDNGDWHVHADFTDGKDSVKEMADQAIRNGLKALAFTEHVRKELTYNFDEYVKQIRNYNGPIKLFVGCEAKVLSEKGDIDASSDTISKCDIVVASFHSFPEGKEGYLNAIKNMLKNPSVDIWGHPLLHARKKEYDISSDKWRKIVLIAKENNKIIEFNNRHNVPSEEFRDIVKEMNCLFTLSSDAHRKEEIRKNE